MSWKWVEGVAAGRQESRQEATWSLTFIDFHIHQVSAKLSRAAITHGVAEHAQYGKTTHASPVEESVERGENSAVAFSAASLSLVNVCEIRFRPPIVNSFHVWYQRFVCCLES